MLENTDSNRQLPSSQIEIKLRIKETSTIKNILKQIELITNHLAFIHLSIPTATIEISIPAITFILATIAIKLFE